MAVRKSEEAKLGGSNIRWSSPDDIELGAGGALIKHLKRGDRVVYVILSRGEKGGDPHQRRIEVEQIIEFLGIKDYYLFNFPDTQLHRYINEIKDALEELIAKYSPVRMYTHSLNDIHQDHRSVAHATLIAGRKVPQILHYMSPTNYNNFRPVYFIDISDVIDEKLKIISFFKSQEGKDYAKRETIAGLNRYFGYIIGRRYAEGFEVIRFTEIW